LFLAYDRLVERRQNVTLASAKRSNAIVNSLFPTEVRDRLYWRENQAEPPKRKASFRLASHPIMSTLTPSVHPWSRYSRAMMEAVNEHSNEPIAEHYPNCTVVCCLVGCALIVSTKRIVSPLYHTS